MIVSVTVMVQAGNTRASQEYQHHNCGEESSHIYRDTVSYPVHVRRRFIPPSKSGTPGRTG